MSDTDDTIRRIEKLKQWIEENDRAPEHLKIPESACRVLREEIKRLFKLLEDGEKCDE